MPKKTVRRFDADVYESADPYLQNRLLLEWLGDDDCKRDLFHWIDSQHNGAIHIPSRSSAPEMADADGPAREAKPPMLGHRTLRLITQRATISDILKNPHEAFSNRVYADLGGGSFMLALDPKKAMAHGAQKTAFRNAFPHDNDTLLQLSHAACQAAAISALRSADFDLAVFAEQAALRFCQKLLGYAMADHPMLEKALGDSYRALVYQVLGRHFVTDPVLIPTAKASMGKLLQRTSQLIDAYEADDEDELKACEDHETPPGYEPVMKRLAKLPKATSRETEINGEQRATLVVGAAIGTVGNVQAAVCNVVQGLFKSQDARSRAHDLAVKESHQRPSKRLKDWQVLLQGFLNDNPPIPFLPRLEASKKVPDNEVLLALGAASRKNSKEEDPLVWGLPDEGTHWCAGKALAWPLIVEIVRHVMALPGLEQRLDPEDARVIGLKKRWGFACESYPLTHRRDRRFAQSSLNVAMRLKAPIRDSADRVRGVIRAGGPRIEAALRESRHVHFAWFELIESDSVLLLHTVYDGPFDAYLQHFALKVGVLFDALFECIEDPPPTPVDKFPTEFVAHLRRYNRAPFMGYFFSAYPGREVPDILRDEWARP